MHLLNSKQIKPKQLKKRVSFNLLSVSKVNYILVDDFSQTTFKTIFPKRVPFFHSLQGVDGVFKLHLLQVGSDHFAGFNQRADFSKLLAAWPDKDVVAFVLPGLDPAFRRC